MTVTKNELSKLNTEHIKYALDIHMKRSHKKYEVLSCEVEIKQVFDDIIFDGLLLTILNIRTLDVYKVIIKVINNMDIQDLGNEIIHKIATFEAEF